MFTRRVSRALAATVVSLTALSTVGVTDSIASQAGNPSGTIVLTRLESQATASAVAQRSAPQHTTLQPGSPNPYAVSGLGEFSAACTFSHRGTFDPIVDPGNPNFRHLHDFFGNRTTDQLSTTDSLVGQPSSCDPSIDSAAYWVPTLLNGTTAIDPLMIQVYYQVRAPQDPALVRTMPLGLRMVAGSAMAMAPQSDHIVQWHCMDQPAISATIPDCGGRTMELLIEFPDCWDGTSLDSADHKSHMSYSRGRDCPATHPVLVPQLSFRVRYGVSGAGLALSSDSMSGHAMPSGTTAHGDFINTWDPAEFERRVVTCLNVAHVCNPAGVVIR
jgi:Domain of unknown function (DUF1996)